MGGWVLLGEEQQRGSDTLTSRPGKKVTRKTVADWSVARVSLEARSGLKAPAP